MIENKYRYDKRTHSQFVKDIKIAHVKEAEIALRLCVLINYKLLRWPKLIAKGTNYTGQYVNNNDVTLEEDFEIEGTKVEITKSDRVCQRVFHEKTSKIDYCIKSGSTLVFVNGLVELDKPKFIWLGTNEIISFTEAARKKYGEVWNLGGGKTGPIKKSAYRYDLEWFAGKWEELPPLPKRLPKEYDSVLEVLNEANKDSR